MRYAETARPSRTADRPLGGLLVRLVSHVRALSPLPESPSGGASEHKRRGALTATHRRPHLLRPTIGGGRILALVLLAALALAVLPPAQPAHAATFTIGCGEGAEGDLIDAIATANANGEDDTIALAPGCTYTFFLANEGANALPVIQPDGGRTLTIAGAAGRMVRSPSSATASGSAVSTAPPTLSAGD